MNEFLAGLLDAPARWLHGHGPEARVVHSTRVRLARNLENLPFPRRADAGVLERLKYEGRKLVENAPYLKGMRIVDLDTLGPLDREFLVERHLVSREFAQGNGRLLLVDDAETVAIMVHEEDHFRFQVLQSGLNAAEAWRILRTIERDADRQVPFAFRPPWGYLTSCPTNLGTGLRVSALCHLPGLALTGAMPEIMQLAGQVAVAVRGFYGEGSEPSGHFFQFSNRTSLGRSEDEMVGEIEGWVRQIIEREIAARERVRDQDRLALEDRVHRAIGLLGHARVLTSQEMMEHLSLIRFGLDMGIVERPEVATLNRLQLLAQPAHLMKRKLREEPDARPLSPVERDIARAGLFRESLEAP